MAIVCDKCKIENVVSNGMVCQKCLDIEADSKIDKSYREKIYLTPDLFQKFNKIISDIESEKKGSKGAFGKFMSVLKTSFINRETGKEINDPTPQVVIPKEKTIRS